MPPCQEAALPFLQYTPGFSQLPEKEKNRIIRNLL